MDNHQIDPGSMNYTNNASIDYCELNAYTIENLTADLEKMNLFRQKSNYNAGPNPRHPAYIIGGLLRDGIDYGIDSISNVMDYVKQSFFSYWKKSTNNEDILNNAISNKNIGMIHHYYHNDKNFEVLAKAQLTSLILENKLDDDENFQKIHLLLKAGVRSENSLYYSAVDTHNIKLINLLNSYNINPDAKDHDMIVKKLGIYKDKGERGFWPIVNKLTEITTDKREWQRVNREIYEKYQFLEKEIDKEISAARDSGKPLMVLMGEEHGSVSQSFINELLLLDIISNKLSIHTVMTEAFTKEMILKFMLWNNYNKITWFSSESIEDKIRSLGLTPKPMDWLRYNPKKMDIADSECQQGNHTACLFINITMQGMAENNLSDSEFFEEIKSRNPIMVEVSLETNVGDTAGIVGALHIYGLMKETVLQDHYYVLPINVASDLPLPNNTQYYDYLDICEAFLQEDKRVISVPEVRSINENSGVFISPDILMEKARFAHERAIQYAFNTQRKQVSNDGSSSEMDNKKMSLK